MIDKSKIDLTGLPILEPLACAIMGLDYPDHFFEWEKLLWKHKRLVVLSSRDHGKTTFFSTIYPLFRAGNNDGYTICIISYSEDQVVKIIRGIKEAIEGSPLLRSLRPRSEKATWTQTEIELVNGSRIIGRSFGSSVRGLHCDLVLVDDPVKDFGGMSADDQERFFRNAVIPTVKPDGQLVVVGTRVYDGDLIDRLEGNSAFVTRIYPALVENKPLWPKRWSKEKLEQRRAEVGDFAFAREYLLQHVDATAQFFKRDWIKRWDVLPERFVPLVSMDPAISATGDYTAIVATGTDADNKTYVLDVVNRRMDDVTAILNELFRVMMTWNAPYAIIETIGFQRLLKHWIYEEMRKRRYYFGIVERKHYNKSKEARIMSLQPRIQSGSLLFGKTHNEIVDQLLMFPKGQHDDMIDALCMQVGYWGKPEATAVGKRPIGSWDWWAEKVSDPALDYQAQMFQDMAQPTIYS